MTENEPTPETLLAPLTKPVPRPAATGSAPPPNPNRIPNMPPRPSATDMARPAEPARVAVPTVRPTEPTGGTESARSGEFGRGGEFSRPGEAGRVPDLPRRLSDTARTEPPATPAPREPEIRQLMVGKEISLQGEITHCDRLLIEGSVEASLSDCRDVDIAESGLFKGSAAIETAEIRGRFEGTLTVRKRLFIRATGQVNGTIRYGQIEVERGGRIAGDIEAMAEPEKPD